MSRGTILIGLLIAGILLLETLGLLVRAEAFLVAGITAAVLLFLIPDGSGRAQNLRDLIFNSLATIGLYAIIFKFRAWLTVEFGRPLAALVCLVLAFIFGAALLTIFVFFNNNTRTDNAE